MTEGETMAYICNKCNEMFFIEDKNWKKCPFCGAEIWRGYTEIKSPYNNCYGLWQVTTENDCEGRSTRDLGTFKGYLDEIARILSGESYYKLNFKLVDSEIPKARKKPLKSVDIQLDIESDTWDMGSDVRVKLIGKLLKDRPVDVKESMSCGSIELVFKDL